MKSKLAGLVAPLGIYAPIALAATDQSKPGDTGILVALGISLAALAYCGNKWRLWWFGFQIGDASGSEFLSALKWTLIGAVVVVASFGIEAQFN